MILTQQMELLLFIIAIGVVQISQVFIQNHSFDMFQINWHRLREYSLRRVSLGLLLRVEDIGHVTIEHCLPNLLFLLFSSFFYPFVPYCFTSTMSSTPSKRPLWSRDRTFSSIVLCQLMMHYIWDTLTTSKISKKNMNKHFYCFNNFSYYQMSKPLLFCVLPYNFGGWHYLVILHHMKSHHSPTTQQDTRIRFPRPSMSSFRRMKV